MRERNAPTPVHGILDQFRDLGDVLAVALLDERGVAIASAGDPGATGALAKSVARLLENVPGADDASPVQRLFEDTDEFVADAGAATVGLLLRRVGDDWALAAIWDGDVRLAELRELAKETASRLQSVS